MGCACGKKKGAVSVFSTAEQQRIAEQRGTTVTVKTSAGSSNGKKTQSGTPSHR